ncbi:MULTISPECIES: glycyl radical protein [Clostridium]|uniref:Glycyl radical protein n=1 Tax=Clostridium lapidicellarium TaxID=3240931 RepID=A0ABV4DZF7_9CLOT
MDALNRGFSKPTKRVEMLKEQILSSVPCIEVERAVLVTQSYKETEGEPIIIRRAKALEKILNEIPIVIRKGELIVGSITKNPRSSQIYPEFSNKWLKDEFDTLGKRKGDSFQISEEVKSKLTDIFEYWDGKTTNELATSYMPEETIDAMNANVFTVGNYYFNGIGHVSVDYGKILANGFNGVIEEVKTAAENADKNDPDYLKKREFWKAVIISCRAVINYAERYSELAQRLADGCQDSVRKNELLNIAKICKKVPADGASTFYEACQSFWFVDEIINIESNGHSVSPGRFDQYMYPYYKNDVAVTKQNAQELIDCLWVKLSDINKVRDKVSTEAFGGYPMFQNLIVGGQTPEGEDATNEISYMAIEATAEVRLTSPSFSVRIWSKTPDEFLLRACELSREGLGMPAYYNDEVIVPALVNRGLTLEDARDYGIIGCVEPQKGGKTDGWHDAAFFNLARVLELTINNGRDNMNGGKQLGPKTGEFVSFRNFKEFMEAFKKQMKYLVHQLVNADNCVDLAHAERAPLPYLSCMVDDCIARGKSVQEGGAHYNFTGPQGVGTANIGDSLEVIKKAVFEDRAVTLAQLKEALDANFEGKGTCSINSSNNVDDENSEYDLVMSIVNRVLYERGQISKEQLEDKLQNTDKSPVASKDKMEDLRQMLMHRVPKFGNDIDEVDELARQGARIYCKEVEKYTNPRGGKFQAGLYPASINVFMGTHVGATPDGRKAREPLADGVSPVRGMDTNGPTAAVNSVAKLDHFIASNGTLLNQKFNPNSLKGDTGLKNLASLIRSYFDQKGMHVQFNVVDRQTLVNAKKHPEQYRDLVIRVAGYSAQFISLDPAVQDDIIERTEQSF